MAKVKTVIAAAVGGPLAVAKLKAGATWESLKGRTIELPKISASFGIALLLVILVSAPLAKCYIEKQRDAWWVAEIRAKSGRVLDVVRENNIEIDAADAAELKGLADADRKAAEDKARLDAQRASTSLPEPCRQCRVPAGRVRLR